MYLFIGSRNNTKEDTTKLPEELWKKHRLERSDRWFEYTPAEVVENDEVELYWDLNIPITDDSGTQQARYYPKECNTKMDIH